MEALDAYKTEQNFDFDIYVNFLLDSESSEYLKETEEGYVFSGVMNEISEENYGLAYSAVGYLIITAGELSVIFYANYFEENHSRSVASVAEMAYSDRKEKEAETHPYYVDADQDWGPYACNSLDLIKSFADKSEE